MSISVSPPRRRRQLAAAVAILPLTLALLGPVSSAPASAAPVNDAAAAPGQVVAVAGQNMTLVIGADGFPYGAGFNGSAQLTAGYDNRSTLTPLTGLGAGVRATAVAASGISSLVLGSDGQAYGAGSNFRGHLTGVGDRSTLTPLAGLPAGVAATAVSEGLIHSLVLGSDGIVYGAGDNSSNQLTGTGDRSTLTPLTGLPAGVRAVAIDAGTYTSLVLGSDGVAYGAGYNENSQLTGTGVPSRTTLTPMPAPAGVSAVAVAAGSGHSLVLGSDGLVYGTGSGFYGQLTGTADRTMLTAMPLPARVTAIAAGSTHSLAVAADGKIYGTGRNNSGQLTGSGDRSAWTPLSGPPDQGVAQAVSGGDDHTVVVTSAGVVLGTGGNAYGEITGTGNKTTLTLLSGQRTAALAAPSITGRTYIGSTARATVGAWAPAPTAYSYQWRRNGAPIGGATKATYRTTSKDWKKKLTVTVTAGRPGVEPASSTSAAVTVLKRPLRYAARKKPSIRGTAKVGKQLKVVGVKRSAWSPKASRVSYQWYRGSTAIPRATKSSYTLKKADRGKKVRVRVLGKRPGYTTGTYATKATKKVRR